jgi:hypothetical protein
VDKVLVLVGVRLCRSEHAQACVLRGYVRCSCCEGECTVESAGPCPCDAPFLISRIARASTVMRAASVRTRARAAGPCARANTKR